MKTIHHQIKPKLTRVQKTALTTQYPFVDINSLLQKCKEKWQFNQVHARMITTGLIHYPPLASKLVASFASSALRGTTSTAFSIADRVSGLDTYTWNTIIRGYLEGNEPRQTILVYCHIRKKALKVDTYTLLFVTKACGLMSLILEGEQIHTHIYRLGFLSEIKIETALLHLYGLFGKLSNVQQIFDEMPHRDLVTWNSVIAAYAHHNCPFKVLEFSRAMVSDNFRPNGMTAVSIVSAVSSLRGLRQGKMVHCYVMRNCVNFDVYVYNALIGMYSKCGGIIYAIRMFRMMPIRSVVSWTTMISGYGDNDYPNEALTLFKEMDSENVKPDEIAMLTVISLCSKLGSFELGGWIDQYVERNGFAKENVSVANALVDMHAKCGNLKKACEIFDRISEKTLVSWASIIHGLAMHGHGISALVRFCQMQREGFEPDGIVFLSILSACSHAGLVNEGRKCFDLMIKDYHLELWPEHYACMVDLLCRAGLINEAFEFILNMPVKADAAVWRILLRACQNQGDTGLATRVLNYVDELGPKNSEDYVLLSNLFSTFSKWDIVEDVRNEMKARGVINRDPGCSSVEMKHVVYRDSINLC
ncbi:Pentatricopeptide repeat [Melia azedarach]|uniref:Pentatricopeptide repeat n=1 Tax=Melia azedarach TaxID=155640 RepID=A0ACC1XLP6_MELAZ|nr:Pentatricopeptide repeat [Melia azedarach]